MKNFDFKRLNRLLPFFFLIILALCSTLTFAGVGNQDPYSSGDMGFGGDFDIGVIIGYLIRLFIESPILGLIVIAAVIIIYRIRKKKAKADAVNPTIASQRAQQQAATDSIFDASESIAEKIHATDPDFSVDQFKGWAQEVFLKIQQAWTEKDWKVIRPFESETLFNQHKQQLDEYIRLKKTNKIEKVAIKRCSLQSFTNDGDMEVLTVTVGAILRDYVVDDATQKVLERDPNRDWYQKYNMMFIRKAGVKTEKGAEGLSITNCPNCGAPTEITSSGQCPYCGSVITNGEHSWVLNDYRSINQYNQ